MLDNYYCSALLINGSHPKPKCNVLFWLSEMFLHWLVHLSGMFLVHLSGMHALILLCSIIKVSGKADHNINIDDVRKLMRLHQQHPMVSSAKVEINKFGIWATPPQIIIIIHSP